MNPSIRKLTTVAIIGALYAVLTMVNPFGYGPIQFRVSELLCILPFFFPASAVGLAIGCLIANIISPYGIADIVFGSLASLLAGMCTAAIGITARKSSRTGWGVCAAACAMPVLFNAPIVGALIAYTSVEYEFWKGFLIYGAQIAFEEATVMFVLGLPILRYIVKNEALTEFFTRTK